MLEQGRNFGSSRPEDGRLKDVVRVSRAQQIYTEEGRLKDIVNFARLSPFQQIGAVLYCVNSAWSGRVALQGVKEGNYPVAAGMAAISLFTLALAGVAEHTAIRQLSKYKKIKYSLEKDGLDKGKLEHESHSWCRRNIVKVAAKDSGYEDQVRDYFKEKGYKWYHLFPDYTTIRKELGFPLEKQGFDHIV